MTAASGPRFRRLLLGLVLMLLPAGLGAGLTQTVWFGRQLSALLEDQLERVTGEQLSVGDVRVGLLERSITVTGLVVQHRSFRPERAGATILAVEEIGVVLGLRNWRPRVRQLEIRHPSVHLHVDEGQLREFRMLTSTTRSGPPATELPWDELRIADGSLVIDAIYGGDMLGRLLLEGVDAVPGDTAGRMTVDAGRLELRIGDLSQVATAVHLPDLRVEPAHILAPAVSLAFSDATVDGSLDLVPGGPIAGLFTVETGLSAWAPLLPGRLHPRGEVLLDLKLSGLTRAPILGGKLELKNLILDVDPALTSDHAHPKPSPPKPSPPKLSPPKQYRLGDLETTWRLHDRQLLLDPLEAAWAGGQVTINGAVDLASKGAWASVSAEQLRLADVCSDLGASPAPWVDASVDLEIQAAGTVQPLRFAGSWKLAGKDLVVATGPVGRTAPMLRLPIISLQGQLDLTTRGIDLAVSRLATRRSHGRLGAFIGFQKDGPLSLDLNLSSLDFSELRPLADLRLGGRGSLTGQISGPFSDLVGRAVLDVVGLKLWDLRFADHARSELQWTGRSHLNFPDLRAVLGQSTIKAAVALDLGRDTRLDLQLLVPDGRLSDLTGIFLDLSGLDADIQGALELRGPVDALDGDARIELSQGDFFGEHFDQGQAQGWMDAGRFTLDELAVWRAGGAESVTARGSVGAGWATNIDVRAGGLALEGMDRLASLGGKLKGTAGLDMVVGGTLMRPEPRGLLRIRDSSLNNGLIPDTALSFVTRDGLLFFGGAVASRGLAPERDDLSGQLGATQPGSATLAAEGLTVAGSLGLWDAQPYSLQARLHDFPVSIFYPMAPDGSALTATMTGVATVDGALGEHPTPVSIDAQVSDTRFLWGRHQLASSAPWTWTQKGEDFSLDGLKLSGGRTELAFSGQRRRTGLTRFAGGGQLDLDLLRLVVPGLERSEGVARLDLHAVSLDGRIRPEITVTSDGATVRGDWFPGTLEDLSLRLKGNPDLVTVDSVAGRLGGGSIQGSGTIETQRFRPRRYDLQATAQDVVVRYFDFLPPVLGDASLHFTGPADSPLLAGLVTVDDMIFSDRIDWESWVLAASDEILSGSVEAERRDWFKLDLDLVSDKTLRVRNNVGDLTASGRLHVIGDTARPGLLGQVRAEPGGRVYLKEREFELQRGELRFVDPYGFDPELDFSLTTLVRTPEQDVRVDAQVAGSWSDWHTTTRSDPSLPQADVNALLVFGMTRQEMERTGALGRALAIEGSDVVFSSIGIVERAEQGIFHLHGLQPLLDPLRPERLDLVSGTSERGSATVSSELRLLYENDLEDLGWRGGTLVFEQNVAGGRDTYLGLEQRLARRLYLRGFWSSQQEERSLSIGGAYGLEVKLRWELQ